MFERWVCGPRGFPLGVLQPPVRNHKKKRYGPLKHGEKEQKKTINAKRAIRIAAKNQFMMQKHNIVGRRGLSGGSGSFSCLLFFFTHECSKLKRTFCPLKPQWPPFTSSPFTGEWFTDFLFIHGLFSAPTRLVLSIHIFTWQSRANSFTPCTRMH